VVAHYARWPAEVGLELALRVAELGPSYGTPTGFVGAFPSVYRIWVAVRFALVPGAAGLRNLDPQTRLPVAKAAGGRAPRRQWRRPARSAFLLPRRDSALFINQGDGSFRQWSPGLDDRNQGAAAGFTRAESAARSPRRRGGRTAGLRCFPPVRSTRTAATKPS